MQLIPAALVESTVTAGRLPRTGRDAADVERFHLESLASWQVVPTAMGFCIRFDTVRTVSPDQVCFILQLMLGRFGSALKRNAGEREC